MMNNDIEIKSCWGPVVVSPNVSFDDVMSEQLATHLQTVEDEQKHQHKKNKSVKENAGEMSLNMLIAAQQQKLKELGFTDFDDVGACASTSAGYSVDESNNDALLAQLLQAEYDKEYDKEINKKQEQLYGKSKFSVDYAKYLRSPGFESNQSDDDLDDDNLKNPKHERNWDSFEAAEKNSAGVTIGKQGFARQGNVIKTKHDIDTCSRRNACKAMGFDISTGDGGGFDMRLNNNVYNALKVHSKVEGKRAARLHEKKEKSSTEGVMDEATRLLLFKFLNSGLLDQLNGIVNTGKEANVYHGIGGDSEKGIVTGEVAIKVFKTTLSEFKNRDPYIKDDFRFKDRYSKQNPRKIIHLWAEKEAGNLNRIRRAGILCPEVIVVRKHILLMTFIGKEKPAPTLKEAKLSSNQLESAYDQVIEIMIKMYNKCELIHGDLSEFNLLWFENKVWVIDVSQSVIKEHPNALRFLLRDCFNITRFFKKSGIDRLNCAQLFTKICDKCLPGENLDAVDLLTKIDNFEKNVELLSYGLSSNDDFFEQMFAASKLDNFRNINNLETSKAQETNTCI